MKKHLILFTAICMALCLAFTAFAAPGVAGTESEEVAAPEEIIDAKELMSVAVRLHSELNDGGLTTEYDLDTYYNYALNNGIFVDGVHAFGSEADIPTRAQVVVALCNAVNGKIDLTAINEVLDMIDVAPDAEYYAEALAFMKAGIIYGYDEYGSFKPSNTVKRYEIGLMVDRLLSPAERVTKEYVVYSSAEHFYLFDDFLLNQGARGLMTGGSGWRIDYTGSTEVGTINNYANILRDFAVDDNMGTYRKIHTQQNGELVFEAVYEFTAGNTLHFGFYDVNGNEIAIAGWQNDVAYAGTYQDTSVKASAKKEPDQSPDVNSFNYYMAGKLRTRIVLDLDNGIYNVWMGSNKIGEDHKLDGTNLAKVGIYTGDAETSVVELSNTHLFKNYNVNDVFRLENQYEAPVGYEVSGKVTVERLLSNANNTGEVNSMKMVTEAGKTTYAKRSFDKATGKVIMEAYALLEDGSSATTVENNAYFTVKSSGADVLKVETKGNEWYVGTTKLDLTTPNDAFTSNVWQWIRIEADTATQKADIKINGKYAAKEVPFLVKVDGFDGLEVGVVGTTADDVIYFDDIEVYETFVDVYNTDADPDNDYVPTPEPLDTGDYILNMSVCNLWRNGSHYGWDWIRPYNELEPVIGYYDEGNPESMDWEIKYLVEHGIKNYMTCWYPHSGGDPVKKPRMVDALHDGYFNAKYSDMMSFSLMFENSGYISDAQKEDFVNNTFPLWMEWYFSDPRYFRITEDGKEYIFLTIYQYIYFLDMCSDLDLLEYDENDNLYFKDQYKPNGTTPNSTVLAEAQNDVVNMINWMEQQIIDAGYADGLIVVYGGSTQSEAAYKTMANMGGDGIILYAWGKTAHEVETQQNLATSHTATAKAQGIDLLTLATPGFNDIGWTSLRPGYMATDDFETILNWHKGQMASNFGSNADSWKSKLITFDTWNEYGEGHYLFPTATENYKNLGYGGFGYLDAIAEVFGGVTRDSVAGDANNTVPTAIQKARIGSMYPDNNDHYIRRDLIAEVETPDTYKHLGGYANMTGTGNYSSSSSWACVRDHSWHLINCYKYPVYESTDGGRLHGKTDSDYARINFENNQFAGINMDDVSYIRMVLQTGTGGSTGKIYFKNTTDTSEYSGYAEERIFRFNTYAEKTEYLINVKEHKQWTGTLAGLMLECTNETGEDVYLYSFELITEDDSTRKPTIYVDQHKYTNKDYGEIRSYDRNEIYIAATEEQGLYKLLHIVYDWNRSTVKNEITGVESPAYVLKLDTPDGTTLEFNYNNKQIKKNGTLVGTDNNLEIYDGAPVIPLIYVLENANFYYAYDFTNRYLYVSVANEFEMIDDIQNGNAEGTNTTEFKGYNGASASIAVDNDPENSSNKVWKITGKDSQSWSYMCAAVDFQAGKSYTVDFDIYLDSLGTSGTAASAGAVAVNAVYPDSAITSGVYDHSTTITYDLAPKTWTHYTHTFTVADTHTETGSGEWLSFYVGPQNNLGATYMIDNVVVRTEPIPFYVYNGDAEIAETADEIADKTDGFYSGHSGNPLTIETESNGNHYWQLTSTQVGNNSYSYIRHDTTFEKGVTYYYKLRAKIGTNAAGESVSNARITLNARYYDAAKLGAAGEWYAHSYDLKYATNGSTVYFSTGGDWITCAGSFTISQGYDSDVHGTNALEEITFYAAPYNTSGVTFMIDDFQISTDPDELN